MFASLTELKIRVAEELFPWDASYDVEAIALELDDTYGLVGAFGGEILFKRIPEAEFLDVVRTYDHTLTEA